MYKEKKMRNKVWDVTKGIAIVAVVMIHSCGFLNNYDIYSYNGYVGVYIRQALNFAVPVFLFISGYLSFKAGNIDSIEFIRKRLLRIITPYIIISMVYIVINYIINGEFSLFKDLILGLLFGRAMSVGYFIIVITQFVILTPLIMKVQKKETHILIMTLISVIGIAYTYFTKLTLDTKPFSMLATFPYSSIIFFVWYPFYHLGFFLSKYQPKIKFSNFLLILSVILSMIEAYALNKAGINSFATSQIKVTSFIFSLCVCAYIYNIRNNKINSSWLEWLGVNSFGIYLIHILFVKLATFIFADKTGENYPILTILIITTSSVVLSSITVLLIKKIFGKDKSKYVIG